jgi:uncharacterized protein YjdB
MKASQLPNLKGLVSNNNSLKIEVTKSINSGMVYAKRGPGYSPAAAAIYDFLLAAIALNRQWTRSDSIDVSPATATKAAAATQQMTVTATFPDTGTLDVTSDSRTTYSSSSAHATVSATGLVTAVSTGSATITATFQGRTDTLVLTVS